MLQEVKNSVISRLLSPCISGFVFIFLMMLNSPTMAQNFKIDWEKELPEGAKIVVEKTFYDQAEKQLRFAISYAVLADGEKVKHGPDETYRDTGDPARVRYYKVGKLHGPYSTFNKDGSFRATNLYLDGKKVPPSVYLDVYGKETLTEDERKWFKIE